MAEPDLVISFVDEDVAATNELANELSDYLVDEVPTLQTTRRRDDPLSQDFGATLVLILGTTAVTALARGIASWLARRQDAKVQLLRVTPDGEQRELVIDGQVSARTQQLVVEFFADG